MKEGLSFLVLLRDSTLVGTWGGTVYSVDDGKVILTVDSPILCGCVTSDNRVAFSTANKELYIDGKVLRTFSQLFSFFFEIPEKSSFFAGTYSGDVLLINNKVEQTVKSFDSPVLTGTMNSETIILILGDGRTVLMNRGTLEVVEIRTSSLGSQIRCVVATDECFASGAIDGRVSVDFFGDIRHRAQRFSFKAHQKPDMDYPVNALVFHNGMLVSAGSDRTVSFWDIENTKRIKTLEFDGEAVFIGSGKDRVVVGITSTVPECKEFNDMVYSLEDAALL